jgi:hypothetical protein
MIFTINFAGGPLDGTVMNGSDGESPANTFLDLAKHVFRVTKGGAAGIEFDVFNPDEMVTAVPLGRPMRIHAYRVDERTTKDDSLRIAVSYVGETERTIAPTMKAIKDWAN